MARSLAKGCIEVFNKEKARSLLSITAAVAVFLLLPSTVLADSGNQALSGTVAATLTATFPNDYSFGALTIGSTNTSTEQTMTIKSNKSWGVKVNSDQAAGKMREWNGSAYVTNGVQLASAMQWARTTPTGGSYADLSSSQALVVGSQSKTDNAGTAVGVTYKQAIAYSDDPTPGSNVYRIAITYDASQGY